MTSFDTRISVTGRAITASVSAIGLLCGVAQVGLYIV